MNYSNARQTTQQRSNADTTLKPVAIKQTNSVKAILQPKLKIGAANDKYEQEADRVADQVMKMSEPRSNSVPDDSSLVNNRFSHKETINRVCTSCIEDDDLLQAKTNGEVTPEVTPAISSNIQSMQGGGQALSRSERNFFEPRFGTDFSAVRIHNDSRAANAARSINARAFTLGHNVVFGAGEYSPDSLSGRKLFAHELTHVMQQQKGSSIIQRVAINNNCIGKESVINAAVSKAQEMTRGTISSLENLRSMMTVPPGPSRVAPTQTRIVQNMFGEVTGLENGGQGGMTNIGRIIDGYNRILSGINSSDKVMRCDPETINDGNECSLRAGFVVPTQRNNIFLCPSFFESDVSVESRAQTIIHEMAHSALRAGHEGVSESGFLMGSCTDESIGIGFEQALKNAYSYGILAGCLQGDYGRAEHITVEPEETAEAQNGDSLAAVSLEAGSFVSPEMRFVTGVGAQFSLRRGEFVVFNPIIGLNIFYAPPGEEQHLIGAIADVGLRIQQPLDGFYVDAAASGFTAIDLPTNDLSARVTGGAGVMLGAGWRWSRIEVGANARALFPIGSSDPASIWVSGRAAVRF